jgi:uncharacterized protein YuzE
MAKAGFPREAIDEVYAAIPHLLRLPATQVWIDYDQEVDVLYLSLQRPQKATNTVSVDEEGVLLSYRGKELVGITVLDASTRGKKQSRRTRPKGVASAMSAANGRSPGDSEGGQS